MRVSRGVVLGLAMVLGGALNAAEITVLSGGAVEPGLKAAITAYEKSSGHQVRITFNTTPQIQKRISDGETFDIVIAPPAALRDFTNAGRVDANGIGIGRVGSGVAVRPGAPVPAIATAEDVKKAVLEADSVVFNRASTGIYIESLFRKLDVWPQVEPKTTRYTTGAEVMKHTLNGKGRELAFGPITEILLEKPYGLVFVGPLPPEIQNFTSYLATPMSAGTQKDLARQLAAFLGGPVAKPLFVAAGIE